MVDFNVLKATHPHFVGWRLELSNNKYMWVDVDREYYDKAHFDAKHSPTGDGYFRYAFDDDGYVITDCILSYPYSKQSVVKRTECTKDMLYKIPKFLYADKEGKIVSGMRTLTLKDGEKATIAFTGNINGIPCASDTDIIENKLYNNGVLVTADKNNTKVTLNSVTYSINKNGTVLNHKAVK